MSRRDSGPPENDAAREAHQTYPGTSVKRPSKTHIRHQQASAPGCKTSAHARALRARRGSEMWREGYCYGFLGALTAAAREINSPDVWAVLSRIGENFTLVDTYELAAGDD